MLYKKSKAAFCENHFKNPDLEYAGAPFWAWNCKMTTQRIDDILGVIKKMGMSGAYIHSRTGLDLKYLENEFMEMVRYAYQKAKEMGITIYLYDEDRWPSGFAGGIVTKEEKYRSRFLTFSPEKLSLNENENIEQKTFDASAKSISSGKRTFLGKYEVILENGFLKSYRFFEYDDDINEEIKGHIWYAYLEISGESPWFNNQTYVNTLDYSAVKKFIDTTYEAYYQEFKNEFGNEIPMIFTDEPQFSFKTVLGFSRFKTLRNKISLSRSRLRAIYKCVCRPNREMVQRT